MSQLKREFGGAIVVLKLLSSPQVDVFFGCWCQLGYNVTEDISVV